MLPWFSFSLFYILFFSVHIVNVNAAKSDAVLDNLNVNIHIYISFLSSGRNLRKHYVLVISVARICRRLGSSF